MNEVVVKQLDKIVIKQGANSFNIPTVKTIFDVAADTNKALQRRTRTVYLVVPEPVAPITMDEAITTKFIAKFNLIPMSGDTVYNAANDNKRYVYYDGLDPDLNALGKVQGWLSWSVDGDIDIASTIVAGKVLSTATTGATGTVNVGSTGIMTVNGMPIIEEDDYDRTIVINPLS